MAREWTSEQKSAIDVRGGSVLVSAAAGSGKTAVLTERIIRRIVDDGIDADRFLVVTFTRAAAAEMRSRISDSLRELIRLDPANLALQRQLMLLQQAQICTIDAFFSGFVRENFERLGVSQNLRIMDDAMLSRLTADTLELVLEEHYARPEPEFQALVRHFGEDNDKRLSAQILKLYKKLRSLPYPFRWMEEQAARYKTPAPAAESGWGRILLEEAKNCLSRALAQDKAALEVSEEDEVLRKGYAPVIRGDIASMKTAAGILEDCGWDEAVRAMRSIEFARLGRSNGCDSELKDKAAALRKRAKANIDAANDLLCCTEADYLDDLASQAPLTEMLFSLTGELWRRLDKAKEEAGAADFADFAYLTLQLLADENGDPTPFAKEYAGRYAEILLDEYQDTNRLQDLIFRCVSQNGENLFFVGDLKQSIYRFRSASPEVFMEKKDSFSPYGSGSFPALITLSNNFRSRKEITGAVNYLFSKTMSRKVGDVDYTDAEKLNCGARRYPDLPEGEKAVSLMLLDVEKDEDVRLVIEARAVAKQIKKMILSGQHVTDGSALRPCRGGDFAILLRSGKGTDQIYAAALKEEGVDALLSASEGYFSSREVSLMVSLLRAMDNPLQDIPMAAVLLSPVFGFSCDQVAALRQNYPDRSLYAALLLEKNVDDPVRARRADIFLDTFGRLREKSASVNIQRLIQYIYDTTDFIEVMNRFSDDAAREANLKLLLKYAGDYAAGGNSELSGFVAYLDALMERGEDFEVANPLTESENAVRIMTIHRSKGLEFPIVILANCSKKHNVRDLSDPVAMDPKTGFAMKRVERELGQSYPTLPLQAVHCREKQDLLSEEMRLLYVALTRASERLMLVCGGEEIESSLAAYDFMIDRDGNYPAENAALARSYGDWILPVLLQHPDCRELRKHYGLSLPETPADFPLEVFWVREQEEPAETEEAHPDVLPDEELTGMLRKRFEWEYPHEADTHIAAKTSVTRIAHKAAQVFLEKPDFSGRDHFTPAEKGSIFHRALQFADFAKGAEDPDTELKRLVEGKWLTEAEAATISPDEFAAFFRSPLMERMLKAERILREYRFFDTIPAAEAGFGEGGDLLIQGIADCIFIENGAAVIVDFKTDRVSDMAELKAHYSGQLTLYRRALEKIFPRVESCILYSTKLKQTINV
ncbi:MAG: helicase-exonuclease AddAB subunit AddA [Oscillospiraceae bacterium]|nr:helicase-exonuclease AddAB subunit AddA [Oscillospiraceae bacterium]